MNRGMVGRGHRRLGQCALRGLVPFLLVGQSLGAGLLSAGFAQGIPPVPAPDLPEHTPFVEELIPYRPLSDAFTSTNRTTHALRYRGQVSGGPEEGWTIENGAVESGELLLLADRIHYLPRTDHLEASGHIRLEAPGLRLLAERLEMNLESRIGAADAVQLELPPQWTLHSQRVEFTTLKHWDFEQVELSPCPEEKPGWSAKLSSLKLDLDEFATFRNARVFLGPVPILYMPWAAYPAKLERSSGLISPTVGYSGHLGSHVGLSWYQVLGDTMDATIRPDYYSKEGVLWGGEFRWAPEPTHQGSIQTQYINQKSDGLDRYRYSLKELWQREDGWQLMADVNMASDSLLNSDYGQGIGQLGTNPFDSSIYIGKNFPIANVNLSASQQRIYFLPDDPYWYDPTFPASLQKRSLPQLQTRFYPVSLGEFYLDGGFRLGRMSYQLDQQGATNSVGTDSSYAWSRNDVMAHLQGRLGQLGPIRADLQCTTRYTFYGKTLNSPVFEPASNSPGNPGFNPFRVDGDPLNRFFGSAKLQFSGSQLGRTFEHFSMLGYTGELKHVVEPYVSLIDNSHVHDEGYIPRYDDLDTRPGVDGSMMGEQSVELGLRQHLFGRPGKGSSFADLVRWRISVKYHFNPVLLPDGRYKQGWSSIDNDIDVEPNNRLRVSFRRSSDLSNSGGADSSLSVDYQATDGSRLSLALFTTGLNTFLVRQQGITLGGLQRIWDDRFRLEYSTNYDYRRHEFASSQVALAYVEPCRSTSLRYSHLTNLNLPPGSHPKEDRIDLVLTLRGLGDLFTFGF